MNGLKLVKKPVVRVEAGALRDGSTGMVVLPKVWAVAEVRLEVVGESSSHPNDDEAVVGMGQPGVEQALGGVAFYRKYTEAMLQRYLRMSTGPGRVPSLLGRELFRGHVTSYKVQSFEDVVIFCHDMETLLKKLRPMELRLLQRVAMQQHTQGEAAGLLGMSLRHCVRTYAQAVDRLTTLLLEAGMLEPMKSCQEGGGGLTAVSCSPTMA